MSLRFNDDSGGDISFSGMYYDPMPTAIVRINTLDGIVVAADGRSVDNDDNSTCENVQKLFPIPLSSGSCVVGISGQCSACFSNDVGKKLDLYIGAICNEAAVQFSGMVFHEFHDFVLTFSDVLKKNVQKRLNDGIQAGIILDQDLADWFDAQRLERGVTFRFAGLLQEKHWFAMINMIFSDLEPSVTLTSLAQTPSDKSAWEYLGSKPVEEALRKSSPEFQSFRTPGLLKLFRNEALNLAEGIEAARSYIEACSSEQADVLHSFCKKIGGNRHIATITKSGGFRWEEPPIPLPS
jgi:hypothetical protein